MASMDFDRLNLWKENKQLNLSWIIISFSGKNLLWIWYETNEWVRIYSKFLQILLSQLRLKMIGQQIRD